jgi:hypothetical protein
MSSDAINEPKRLAASAQSIALDAERSFECVIRETGPNIELLDALDCVKRLAMCVQYLADYLGDKNV